MKTSDPVTPLESHDAISVRAAEFLALRRDEAWNDADQAELEAWMAESVLHEVAYLRVEEGSARVDQLAGLAALEFKCSGSSGSGNFPFRGFWLPLLAAASIAAVALWGTLFAATLIAPWLAPSDRTDSTDVGGRTLLSFSDHTEIELNTNTAVRTRMTTGERTVWLEKGEAWFRVAHDAAHPFTVIVGTHRITDLGTEFLIRRDGDAVDVTLLKGRAGLSADGTQTATLTPGEEAIATPTALSVTRKSPQELADALAWRRGVLVFRDTRLSDAVREVNRYNTIKLVIADPSIEDLKFTGEIKNDNVEDFLQAAQSLMKLHADRQGKDILLSRATPEQMRRATHTRREP